MLSYLTTCSTNLYQIQQMDESVYSGVHIVYYLLLMLRDRNESNNDAALSNNDTSLIMR